MADKHPPQPPTDARSIVTRRAHTTPDFPEERKYREYSKQEASAKDILGPDTFRRKDRAGARSIFPDVSEGARATMQLQRGATPSDIVRTNVGFRDRDISLPSETKKPTKSLTRSRSLSGGKR